MALATVTVDIQPTAAAPEPDTDDGIADAFASGWKAFVAVLYGIVLVAIHSALEWIILHLHRSQVEHLRAERQAAYDEVANSYSSYRPDVMGAAISTHDQQGAQG